VAAVTSPAGRSPSALAPFFLTQRFFDVIAAALVGGDPITTDLLVAAAAVTISRSPRRDRSTPAVSLGSTSSQMLNSEGNCQGVADDDRESPDDGR